jgi:Ca-activated chloride channel family protein
MASTVAMNAVFDRPALLVLALVFPALFAFLVILARRRRRARLAKLGGEMMVARLVPLASLGGPWGRVVRLGLAGVLAAVALAGPRWGFERIVVRGQGVDVVLALDASLSMLAQDVKPSRLEVMKQEVRRLRAISGADRVGVLAFAGRSYILTPLTVDAGALNLVLDNLDPSVVGQQGSSLSRTIRQGVSLLEASTSGSDRALILMSDGESHEPVEDITAAATAAQEAGVAVITVGFGTEQGATIPEEIDGTVAPHRDENGQIVTTHYSPENMRAVAEAAQGTFIDAAETDKAAKIQRALSRLRATGRAAAAGRERTPRFQYFLFPAIALLLLDTFLADRRGRRRGIAASTTTAAAGSNERVA